MTRKFRLEDTRNIGIMAHIDAGKTTTTERILFYSGKLHRMGEVHDGTATTDWMPQEQERGITITSAAITTEWRGNCINIIDTPGHVDFTMEVERSLRVLDGVVSVFCAKGGVEPQSETVWRQADYYQIPRIAYINKMDIMGADFYNCIDMMKNKLKTNAVPIQLPLGKEGNYRGIIDLVSLKAYYYGDLDKTVREEAIPEEMSDLVQLHRSNLIETIIEHDEGLMSKYLDDQEITEEEIKGGIRKMTLAVRMTPVLCGSSYKNKGIQQLLDAIVDFLPSLLDLKASDSLNEIESTDDAPFAALVFKVMTDPHVGKLYFIRVYSGSLKAGSYIYNSTKEKRERISHILQMQANSREDVSEIHSGDIVAVIGLKNTITGDTLCLETNPIVLESMVIPEPVISVAIEPRTKSGQDKMNTSLQKLMEEDPTFKVYTDLETGQTIIAGMGELHLEIIIDRMRCEFKVETNVGKPRVAYKETIRKMARAEGKLIRQTGGKGQYGHCLLEIEPLEPGKGYEFVNRVVGGAIPREYIPAIDKGIQDAMKSGGLGGYPMVDIRATVTDGSYHEVDSSEMAFRIAGSMAFKEACRRADPILLEPIMNVNVIVPNEYVGDVVGDISLRRGRIEGLDEKSGIQTIRSFIPLSEMFEYTTTLRSKTQGRGVFTMQTSHFEEVSKSIQEMVLGKR